MTGSASERHAIPADTGMLRAYPANSDEHARETGRTNNRLAAEFGALVGQSTVTRVVRSCRHDLRGAPPGALAELVERLARQRLRSALHLDAEPPDVDALPGVDVTDPPRTGPSGARTP